MDVERIRRTYKWNAWVYDAAVRRGPLLLHERIVSSPNAIEVALAALRPRGRFVAAGAQLIGGLRGVLLNPLTLAVSLPAVTSVAALRRPWAQMEERLPGIQLEEHIWGTAFLAWASNVTDAGTTES